MSTIGLHPLAVVRSFPIFGIITIVRSLLSPVSKSVDLLPLRKEHLLDGCSLLAEARRLVERKEMYLWRTRHSH